MSEEFVKDEVKRLKDLYPKLKSLTINYNGAGDSFNEFWNFNPVWEEEVPFSEQIDWNVDFEELLWYAINNSEADFNNDGSEGEILIDLENSTLSIDNYVIVRNTIHSGTLTWD